MILMSLETAVHLVSISLLLVGAGTRKRKVIFWGMVVRLGRQKLLIKTTTSLRFGKRWSGPT